MTNEQMTGISGEGLLQPQPTNFLASPQAFWKSVSNMAPDMAGTHHWSQCLLALNEISLYNQQANEMMGVTYTAV